MNTCGNTKTVGANGLMQIGELATRVGVTTRTLRYYEELGLIQPEERSEGGFRLYSENQLRRLKIVQSLKELGFDLERICELFNLRHTRETGGELAQAVIAYLERQQEEIDARIAHYLCMKERNQKAVEVLNGCRCCTIRVFERDCHQCEVYRRHEEVPDLIECAIYES
jgi:MerR family Zn(II)-responsive transcriptional regulator of zntA